MNTDKDLLKKLQEEHDLLEPYFDAVKDKNDWKNPIRAIIKEKDLVLTIRAIAYFTANATVSVNLGNGEYEIWSNGYRNGPAGDH